MKVFPTSAAVATLNSRTWLPKPGWENCGTAVLQPSVLLMEMPEPLQVTPAMSRSLT